MYFNKNDISEITEVTAEELENAVNTLKENNGLKGLGAYFIEAQNKYNINAIMLVAIACLESAYGTSKLAIEKNNLFGLRANDEYRDDPSKYGDYFSAIMLVAIACLESAYGTSKLAIEKNNLFGLRANDEYRDDPSKYGDYFSTKEDCIDYAGHKLRYQYKLAIEKNNLFGLRANDEYRDDPSKYGDYFSTKEDCIDYAGHKLRYQYLEEDEKAPWCYCYGETDIYSIGAIWCSNPEWGDYVVDLSTRLSKAIESERDSQIDWKGRCLKAEDKLDRIRAVIDEVDSCNLEYEESEAPSYEY